jgi:hypothetical protein
MSKKKKEKKKSIQNVTWVHDMFVICYGKYFLFCSFKKAILLKFCVSKSVLYFELFVNILHLKT